MSESGHGYTVVVAKLPSCDTHRYNAYVDTDEALAQYDARTKLDSGLGGTWANMCSDCFHRFGAGVGVGIGQELVLNA